MCIQTTAFWSSKTVNHEQCFTSLQPLLATSKTSITMPLDYSRDWKNRNVTKLPRWVRKDVILSLSSWSPIKSWSSTGGVCLPYSSMHARTYTLSYRRLSGSWHTRRDVHDRFAASQSYFRDCTARAAASSLSVRIASIAPQSGRPCIGLDAMICKCVCQPCTMTPPPPSTLPDKSAQIDMTTNHGFKQSVQSSLPLKNWPVHQVDDILTMSPQRHQTTLFQDFIDPSRTTHARNRKMFPFLQRYATSVWQVIFSWADRGHSAQGKTDCCSQTTPNPDKSCTMLIMCLRLDVEVEVFQLFWYIYARLVI